MKKILFPVLIIAFAAVLGTAAYLKWKEQRSSNVELPPIVEAPPVAAEPRYPIPATPEAESAPDLLLGEQGADDDLELLPDPSPDLSSEQLPSLNESSAILEKKLSSLVGEGWTPELFVMDEIIRRFVVTIDNLPNKKLPRQHLPVNRATGSFLVAGEGDSRMISPDNAARYRPYVQFAVNIDAQKLATLYVRYYPLFQQAYAELGNPNAYFNDRLIDVIDHLLNTPAVDEPLRLVQPKVFYEYADPELEALSAGQKTLLRMGSANAKQIKGKLRELRQALTRESPQP